MKATALYYQISKEKEAELTKALELLGVNARRVTKAEAMETVGYLAGVPGAEPASGPKSVLPIADVEVVVMCGFTKIQFELFMALFQKHKLPPIMLKAMMTPTNQDWSFAKLIGELKAEHALLTMKQNTTRK